MSHRRLRALLLGRVRLGRRACSPLWLDEYGSVSRWRRVIVAGGRALEVLLWVVEGVDLLGTAGKVVREGEVSSAAMLRGRLEHYRSWLVVVCRGRLWLEVALRASEVGVPLGSDDRGRRVGRNGMVVSRERREGEWVSVYVSAAAVVHEGAVVGMVGRAIRPARTTLRSR